VEATPQPVKSKKTTKVTLESRGLLRLRLPEDAVMGWCPACGDDVRWVTVREAAAISGLTEREIHRRMEAGSLHFLESFGALLVCFLSLAGGTR
jgi:hypothetical protein